MEQSNRRELVEVVSNILRLTFDKTPLESAGERLDAAALQMCRICAPDRPLPSEAEMGRAEDAYYEARLDYCAVLAGLTGEDAEITQRRLNA